MQTNISTAGIFLASCSTTGWVFSVWGLVGLFWFVSSQRHYLLLAWAQKAADTARAVRDNAAVLQETCHFQKHFPPSEGSEPPVQL